MPRDWLSILNEFRAKLLLAVERCGPDAQFRLAVSPDLEERIVARWPRDANLSNSAWNGRATFADIPVVARDYVPAHSACMVELAEEDPDRLDLETDAEVYDSDLAGWVDEHVAAGRDMV